MALFVLPESLRLFSFVNFFPKKLTNYTFPPVFAQNGAVKSHIQANKKQGQWPLLLVFG